MKDKDIKCPVCGSTIKRNVCKNCGYQLKMPSFPSDMEKVNISDFQRKTPKVKKRSKKKRDPLPFLVLFIVIIITSIIVTYRFQTFDYKNKSIKDIIKKTEEQTIELTKEISIEETKEKEFTSTEKSTETEEISIKGLIYQEIDGSMRLVKCNSSEKNIVILDNVNGIAVREIGEDALNGCEHLEEIHIPEGIQIIRRGAFNNCKKLKKIFLPESLSEIEDHSFDNCSPFTIVGTNGTYAFSFSKEYNVEWEEKCQK